MVENGVFSALAQEGVNDAKKVENELKEDKDRISVPTCKSATFTFMSCYKHPTSSFFLVTPHRPTLELALHLLDHLNAPPSLPPYKGSKGSAVGAHHHLAPPDA